MFITYGLIDDKGNLFYVGAGNQGRPAQHLNGTSGRKEVLSIVKEHKDRGSEISVRIFGEFERKSDAFRHERELICKYGRRSDGGLLINKSLGGAGNYGYEFTKDQRATCSLSAKARYSREGEREKVSEGTRRAMECEKVRSRISQKLKKKWQQDEFRKKLVDAHTGVKDSDETKARKAEAQKLAWSEGKRTGKYTDEQVRDVYLSKGKESASVIAQRHGMNPTYVHKIWRHERCVMNLIRLGFIKEGIE